MKMYSRQRRVYTLVTLKLPALTSSYHQYTLLSYHWLQRQEYH